MVSVFLRILLRGGEIGIQSSMSLYPKPHAESGGRHQRSQNTATGAIREKKRIFCQERPKSPTNRFILRHRGNHLAVLQIQTRNCRLDLPSRRVFLVSRISTATMVGLSGRIKMGCSAPAPRKSGKESTTRLVPLRLFVI